MSPEFAFALAFVTKILVVPVLTFFLCYGAGAVGGIFLGERYKHSLVLKRKAVSISLTIMLVLSVVATVVFAAVSRPQADALFSVEACLVFVFTGALTLFWERAIRANFLATRLN